MNETAINERFDRIDSSLERISDRLDQVSQRLDHLTKYVLDFREETASRLQLIETRLDYVSTSLLSLETRFPAQTKATFEMGSLVSKLMREQSVRIGTLEETVSRLVNPAA